MFYSCISSTHRPGSDVTIGKHSMNNVMGFTCIQVYAVKPEPDLLKKVTNSELEFPASTVGYPKDIVRDPVVTFHGPAKGTTWFPCVRHQGEHYYVKHCYRPWLTNRKRSYQKIVMDPAYLHKPGPLLFIY